VAVWGCSTENPMQTPGSSGSRQLCGRRSAGPLVGWSASPWSGSPWSVVRSGCGPAAP
jgi:hypothetical protein